MGNILMVKCKKKVRIENNGYLRNLRYASSSYIFSFLNNFYHRIVERFVDHYLAG